MLRHSDLEYKLDFSIPSKTKSNCTRSETRLDRPKSRERERDNLSTHLHFKSDLNNLYGLYLVHLRLDENVSQASGEMMVIRCFFFKIYKMTVVRIYPKKSFLHSLSLSLFLHLCIFIACARSPLFNVINLWM